MGALVGFVFVVVKSTYPLHLRSEFKPHPPPPKISLAEEKENQMIYTVIRIWGHLAFVFVFAITFNVIGF